VAGAGTASAADLTVSEAPVAFPDGATTAVCTLPTTQDAVDEPDETFAVELVAATGGADLGDRLRADATIVDDDAPADGPLVLDPPVRTVGESAGAVGLTVRRVGAGALGDASVLVSLEPGTAGADDVQGLPARVVLPSGVAAVTVPLAVVDDRDDEPDVEELSVVLSDPGGGAALGDPSRATVRIADDDGAGSAAWAADAVVTPEGAGSVTVGLVRVGGAPVPATIDWSVVPGTATAADVGATSGTVAFPEGATTAVIAVALVGDALDEPAETLRLTLHGGTGGLRVGAPASTTVTIVDDDRGTVARPVTIVTKGRLRLDARRRAAIVLSCPRAATLRCVGRLAVVLARPGRVRGRRRAAVVLAAARYAIAPGRRATVRPRLSAAAAARLAGRGSRVSLRATAARKGVRVATRRIVLSRAAARRRVRPA
jgi:hypothetical protein